MASYIIQQLVPITELCCGQLTEKLRDIYGYLKALLNELWKDFDEAARRWVKKYKNNSRSGENKILVRVSVVENFKNAVSRHS